MKPFLIYIIAISFLVFGCHKTSYTSLKKNEFIKKTNTLKAYSLTIDTRSKTDYNKKHIEKAINIPFTKHFLSDLEKSISKEYKSVVLFIYASSKEITLNQISEIKQNLSLRKKNNKIYSINYLSEDYN